MIILLIGTFPAFMIGAAVGWGIKQRWWAGLLAGLFMWAWVFMMAVVC